jgi:DNA-binding transcriptional ArsR family regulator
MRYVIEVKDDEILALPTKIIEPKKLRRTLSSMSIRILKALAMQPMYPKMLAKQLGITEQRIYYHIKNLEKAGIIKVVFKERYRGTTAKYYTLDKPAISVLFKDMKTINKFPLIQKSYEKFLYPFIDNYTFNSIFIVGSPELHGEYMVKSRDLPLAVDLAMFFATFINDFKRGCVKLDVEVNEKILYENNLILIGGPAVNSIVAKVNRYLPINFLKKDNFYQGIFSKITRKMYTDENIGMIVKIKSPFNRERSILVLAGRRYLGTQASIVAILKKFNNIVKGNKYNKNISAHVVQGKDTDSDGIIDDVIFLE